jgi:mannan endo-1,6-alpha-mannosidase
LNGYLAHAQVFFPAEFGGKTMMEVGCESAESKQGCNKDQVSFKGYFARNLAVCVQMAPFTTNTIMPWIQTSAMGAVKQCSGGPPDGLVCGRNWFAPSDDGQRNIGNQMNILGVVAANLAVNGPIPADTKTGTSIGNPSAGGIEKLPSSDDLFNARTITTADRAGAWIVTLILFLTTTGGGAFLILNESSFAFGFR